MTNSQAQCIAVRSVIIFLLLTVPLTARADVVTDWNAIAVQLATSSARPGQAGAIDIAMPSCHSTA